MLQGSRLKPVMARAERLFAVFGINGVMPGMQQAKYMVGLMVYIQGNFCVRKYKKKRKKE